ncbi:hypothetical protein BRADI_4g22176v3 [Brachypodium distachyon]|uniref:Uncharacterized protein n=1 Tax=Brachypodium distachyon TaxID=15368 RepID=A0A0Q3PHV8_BRADI|nr:hypothetical protein BRADI_4g22176v3 [Brachypodium distachyon]
MIQFSGVHRQRTGLCWLDLILRLSFPESSVFPLPRRPTPDAYLPFLSPLPGGTSSPLSPELPLKTQPDDQQ